MTPPSKSTRIALGLTLGLTLLAGCSSPVRETRTTTTERTTTTVQPDSETTTTTTQQTRP